MTNTTLEQALENIYASLNNDNFQIDLQIAELKKVLASEGKKSVEVDTKKLAQQNRQGRKMMQSYFKKRGVNVTFSKQEENAA